MILLISITMPPTETLELALYYVLHFKYCKKIYKKIITCYFLFWCTIFSFKNQFERQE